MLQSFGILLEETIKNIIIDLKKTSKISKPDLGDKGMYGHDSTKGGARQDTYLDPKIVNQNPLWPQKLLVAEIRRGDMEKQLEDAGVLHEEELLFLESCQKNRDSHNVQELVKRMGDSYVQIKSSNGKGYVKFYNSHP